MYYSTQTSRHRQNKLSFVPKKTLTWVPREARGALKAIAGIKTDNLTIALSTQFFVILGSVSFWPLSIIEPVARVVTSTLNYLLNGAVNA